MDGGGLYVTLFSNSFMIIYSKNKTTCFTVQLTHEIVLDTDRWKVGRCDFSGPPPEVGTLKPKLLFGDTHALIYCTLINRQVMGLLKNPCIRTYIHPTTFCNHVFKSVYCMSVQKRRYRDIPIRIVETLGNQIQFGKHSKIPIKIVLYFRRV